MYVFLCNGQPVNNWYQENTCFATKYIQVLNKELNEGKFSDVSSVVFMSFLVDIIKPSSEALACCPFRSSSFFYLNNATYLEKQISHLKVCPDKVCLLCKHSWLPLLVDHRKQSNKSVCLTNWIHIKELINSLEETTLNQKI